MKKHDLCVEIISLENEIEFLKEIKEPTLKKKKELNLLYKKLKAMSPLEKRSEDETFGKHLAFDVS